VFLVWGAFHGLFLVLERVSLGRQLTNVPPIVRRGYTLLVVMVGWVFFRANSLDQVLTWLYAMAGHAGPRAGEYPAGAFLDRWTKAAIVVGVVASFPLAGVVETVRERLRLGSDTMARLASISGLLILLSLSLTFIAAGTYSPFLYFRF
jgi:alginate O-acetyltransferase complex protein AlgI